MSKCILKILLVVLLFFSACAWDKQRVDGRIIKVEGKYYRLNNTMGNVYRLDPVYMDTIIVLK